MRIINLTLLCLLTTSLISQTVESPIKDQYRSEIKSLVRQASVLEAFDFIQQDASRTLEEHIYLNEIPAPPFKEEKRAAAFAKMLTDLELDSVWIDAVGNVIGLIKGTDREKVVALDGHLDTVFPKDTDVTVKIKNDTLFAPGIADDTRSLAMMTTIIRALRSSETRLKSDVLIIGSVGEEGLGDLRGVKELFSDRGPQIDSWISIDGGTIGRVNIKGLGSYRYRVTFKGPGGHSWGAFGLVNPHHALGDAIRLFVDEADHFTSYGDRTSYNVGRIGGGTSVNSVPFESWMEIDMRSVNPLRLDTLESKLYASIQKALDKQNELKRLGDELLVDIDKIGNRPSGELSAELPLIQRAMASTAYFGKRPQLTRGSTNSNIPISLGIPAVTIGRGGVGAYAHSLDEWWLDKEGYKAIQLAYLLMVSEAGLVEN